MGTDLIRWLARAICWIFYRVDREGAVPAEGPVLILPNHPNALLDPAVIWATAGRDVRFLAKSTLFDGALAPILRMARAIPVYRRFDQGVDPSRNTETFAAVDTALADGGAVCLFPEGVSHSTGRLVALRTGAARMALTAERRGIAVSLVAVGLNFDRKTAFRSRATVLYGRPFSLGRFAADQDDQAAVRLATDAIAGEMRRLLVEADPESDAAMVARVERLYAAARGRPQSPHERIARRQAIARGMERLRVRDQARFEEIALRLRRYDQRLQRFGLARPASRLGPVAPDGRVVRAARGVGGARAGTNCRAPAWSCSGCRTISRLCSRAWRRASATSPRRPKSSSAPAYTSPGCSSSPPWRGWPAEPELACSRRRPCRW